MAASSTTTRTRRASAGKAAAPRSRRAAEPTPGDAELVVFPDELHERAERHAGFSGDEGAWERWLDSHDGADRQAELDADLDRPLSAAVRVEMALTAAGEVARTGGRRLLGAFGAGRRRQAAAG